MDDMLDKKSNEPVGGPHAGRNRYFNVKELGDEVHKMKAGDLQMMTAGGGIIHTETIDKKARMRLLQLWLNLPKKDRWITPRVQDISVDHVPKISSEKVDLKLYSGSLAGISSPVKNHVPVIIVDIHMQPNAVYSFNLPASYSTFYVLDEITDR
jgi:redox-sensitive bicupin YhaK (pirin superfamily)